MKLFQYKGITLLELLITVTIIGILAGFSSVNYTSYVRDSRRSDAINSIFSISLAEERYRSSNSSYGTLAQVWNNVSTTTGGFYTISISNITGSSYTITATALGNQANDKEGATSCTPLVFAYSAGTINRTPNLCWPT